MAAMDVFQLSAKNLNHLVGQTVETVVVEGM
jgi:hypothetical protein